MSQLHFSMIGQASSTSYLTPKTNGVMVLLRLPLSFVNQGQFYIFLFLNLNVKHHQMSDNINIALPIPRDIKDKLVMKKTGRKSRI